MSLVLLHVIIAILLTGELGDEGMGRTLLCVGQLSYQL
jgi:hypothetical protein